MLNSFKDPPPEHRIHALWLWNSTLDPDEVERQARELHRQGFGGFVIEHDPDILERNSEPEVMRALDRAARTAFDSSLRAYLHDPRKEFVTPQNHVWSKFMYFLGHKDRADSRNPAALKNPVGNDSPTMLTLVEPSRSAAAVRSAPPLARLYWLSASASSPRSVALLPGLDMSAAGGVAGMDYAVS